MRYLLLSLLLLLSLQPQAARITDKLLVGLYAETRLGASPIKVLPSGTPFETLQTEGDFTRIRLGDYTEGWVESRFITNEKSARIMLLELQAKNSRLRQKLRDNQAGAASLRQRRKDNPGANRGAEPLEEIARLQAALDLSQQTLAELNRQPSLATNLARENGRLRLQIQQAAAVLTVPPTRSQPTEPELRLNAWWLPLLVALALLLSFIGGIAFKGYRLSKRYGGFRL